jgi:hypothetical protein
MVPPSLSRPSASCSRREYEFGINQAVGFSTFLFNGLVRLDHLFSHMYPNKTPPPPDYN